MIKDPLIIPWDSWEGKDVYGDYYKEIDEVVFLPNIKRVAEFFKEYKKDCILVSPCSDFNISKFNEIYFVHEMKNSKAWCVFKEIPQNIKGWFSTGLNIKHDRVFCFPIGTLKTHLNIMEQVPLEEKIELLYINFTIDNNPHRVDFYNNHSGFIDWATVEWPLIGCSEDIYGPTRINFFNKINKHKFTLCPSGNGFDTYRFYEALYFGSIPIVLDTPWSKHFEDLPILRVGSFFDLTPQFLEHKYKEIKAKEYNLEKLTFQYWKNRILEEKNKL